MTHVAAEFISRWHEFMMAPSAKRLSAIIADGCVFHSPVVHTPQVGKEITMGYLLAAGTILNPDSKFTYVRELADGHNAMLEFTALVEGIHINGVDIIRFNDDGQIVDFKVMVRPLKAVNMLHAKMMTALEAQQ